MVIEDKINLLTYLVPRFGSGNPEQEEALTAVASGLKPTFALIRSKSPDLSEADVQVLGTELLCAEILIPGRSTKKEFAAWLGAMSESDLKDILAERRTFNNESATEITAFREEREEKERQREELQKKYEEQVAAARKARTMGFNPSTGKFQDIPEKKK
jgi:cell division protein ZapA (FtsZ GTPase activity inhibitor)